MYKKSTNGSMAIIQKKKQTRNRFLSPQYEVVLKSYKRRSGFGSFFGSTTVRYGSCDFSPLR
jgi:hypothetical protein